MTAPEAAHWDDLSAFSVELGLQVTEAVPGRARIVCDWQPMFANMAGVAHGGVVTAIMDTACGVALTAGADGKRAGKVATVSFALSFLAPFAEGDRVTATAQDVGGGKSLRTAQVRLEGPNGTVLATGHGVFRRIG